LLGAVDGIGCLHRDAVKEEQKPFGDLASFADGLQAVIVVALALVEVSGQVQQGAGRRLLSMRYKTMNSRPSRPFPSRKGWMVSNW